jgi:hypothetical protein
MRHDMPMMMVVPTVGEHEGSVYYQRFMSKLVRRTHMYLALFLAPWLLMYAASTFVMNHRASFRPENPGPPRFEKERDLDFQGAIAPGTAPTEIAARILGQVGMEGAHNVTAASGPERIIILRQDAVAPRRIVFTSADNRIIVEKQVFAMPAFLERMHRRRGFQHEYGSRIPGRFRWTW